MTTQTESAAPPSIARDGDRLIVPRGADISGLCLQCASAASGRPLVKHLFVRKGGMFGRGSVTGGGSSIMFVFDLVLVVIWLVWLAVDLPKSRHRRVSFSLCAAHRKYRLWYRCFFLLGLPLGIALLLTGIFGNQPGEWDLLPFVPGVILIFCSILAFAFNPDPKLAAENPQFLWLMNVGKPFLARYPGR